MLIVQNKESEKICVEIYSDFNGSNKFVEQFDNSTVEVTEKAEGRLMQLKLEPNEVKVYRDAVL